MLIFVDIHYSYDNLENMGTPLRVIVNSEIHNCESTSNFIIVGRTERCRCACGCNRIANDGCIFFSDHYKKRKWKDWFIYEEFVVNPFPEGLKHASTEGSLARRTGRIVWIAEKGFQSLTIDKQWIDRMYLTQHQRREEIWTRKAKQKIKEIREYLRGQDVSPSRRGASTQETISSSS